MVNFNFKVFLWPPMSYICTPWTAELWSPFEDYGIWSSSLFVYSCQTCPALLQACRLQAKGLSPMAVLNVLLRYPLFGAAYLSNWRCSKAIFNVGSWWYCNSRSNSVSVQCWKILGVFQETFVNIVITLWSLWSIGQECDWSQVGYDVWISCGCRHFCSSCTSVWSVKGPQENLLL